MTTRIHLISLAAALMFTIISPVTAATAAEKPDTLYVSELYSTFVVFSTDVSFADLSNRQYVVASKIDNQSNAVGLKALTPFETTCSFTAFESNGRIHSFIVAYRQHPAELIIDMRKYTNTGDMQEADVSAAVIPIEGTGRETLSVRRSDAQKKGRSGSYSQVRYTNAPALKDIYNKEAELFHIATKEYGVTLYCTNLYSYSDITYITLSLENNSNISYEATTASFSIQSRKQGKRAVDYNNIILPKSSYGTLLAAPGNKAKMSFSLDKLTLSKDQVLKIMLHENKGERNFTLTLDWRDINNAAMPL